MKLIKFTLTRKIIGGEEVIKNIFINKDSVIHIYEFRGDFEEKPIAKYNKTCMIAVSNNESLRVDGTLEEVVAKLEAGK